MPPEMIAAGFDRHLLTRFRFKSRIDVAPVDAGGDMVLGADGERVFSGDGQEWHVAVDTTDADKAGKARAFVDWLLSDPGRAAIEGFAPGGTARYSATVETVAEAAPDSFEGDDARGADLALLHCGRCHVVDARNKWGGIGSTPSFAALRGRENWLSLFSGFHMENPHPTFTQIEGITDPFASPPHIAPIEMTLDDVEAILAFVSNLAASDLGAPVQLK